MGGLLSYLWGGTPASTEREEVDPATGLSPKERKLVQDTWKLVNQDAKGNGVALFMALFKAYPHYQREFPSLAKIPLSELATSKKMIAHANTVMYSLTSVIDNLSDPECLQEMLQKIGENHGRRKTGQRPFLDLKGVFIQLLQGKLGKQMTPQAIVAWGKTVDVMYAGIFKGLDITSEDD
uniref:Globin domain-containing protein n=1 Tax=Timema poppense TaxID=170557 RepID=A0A7R9H7S9_TIMPO|nr:unnamed protein product [Timema poppensis]